jgi:hypothetical protein
MCLSVGMKVAYKGKAVATQELSGDVRPSLELRGHDSRACLDVDQHASDTGASQQFFWRALLAWRVQLNTGQSGWIDWLC